jgi:signal transduction histidine kinase
LRFETSINPARPTSSDDNTWERRFFKLRDYAPYAFLGVATLLSEVAPGHSPSDRLSMLGLAALAAAWVLVMYTLPPREWRKRTGAMLVYFSGLLVICWLLEARSILFFAFVVTGFLQAFAVLPAGPLAILGVTATSSVLYLSSPDYGWRFPGSLPFAVFVIGFQTIMIGGVSYLVREIVQESEKRQRLVAELEAALEENAGLHVQLLTQAREAGMLDERQRMAREIHDTLAQGLTGIITQLEAAEQASQQPEHWLQHLDQARALARESLTEARRSVQALRPEPLEGSHLAEAIADMAKRWSETASVALRMETTGQPLPLLPELEITLFRVAQEALTNVAKHAKASKVGVTVSYMDDMVLLDVRDDGVGFTPTPTAAVGRPSAGHGFGLKAMGQRLRRVGGTLEIESSAGAGTAVNASVPAIRADGGA